MDQLYHFEPKAHPLASRRVFYLRQARNILWSLGLIIAWLIIGMAGYMGFEGMSGVDAFVNAAMILSGMGPIGTLATTSGKIFAGLYAIYSGIFVFGIAGLALLPVFHRMLHRFHLQQENQARRSPPKKPPPKK
ncbi:MAG TPA: hypothetical protein VL101_02320 [Nordella sp.]|nr:hypothetical protein [Nordella sp.]